MSYMKVLHLHEEFFDLFDLELPFHLHEEFILYLPPLTLTHALHLHQNSLTSLTLNTIYLTEALWHFLTYYTYITSSLTSLTLRCPLHFNTLSQVIWPLWPWNTHYTYLKSSLTSLTFASKGMFLTSIFVEVCFFLVSCFLRGLDCCGLLETKHN